MDSNMTDGTLLATTTTIADNYVDSTTSSDQTSIMDRIMNMEALALTSVALMCTLGSISVLTCTVNFLASRFVSVDRNTTVVVIANICVAEGMAGLYGLTKSIFLYMQPPYVNCFLWDSMLFTSISMSTILLPCLVLECCVSMQRIAKVTNLNWNDKRRLVVAMVFLWDAAVVLGFMPLLGWNKWDIFDRDSQVCKFLQYYSTKYLVMLSVFVILGILVTVGAQSCLCILCSSVEQRIPDSMQTQFKKRKDACSTYRVILIIHILCYMPWMGYVLTNSLSDTGNDENKEDKHDIYLIILGLPILFKSILLPTYLSIRTPQVHLVLCKALHLKLEQGISCCDLNSPPPSDIGDGQRNLSEVTTEQPVSIIHQQTNNHRKSDNRERPYMNFRAAFAHQSGIRKSTRKPAQLTAKLDNPDNFSPKGFVNPGFNHNEDSEPSTSTAVSTCRRPSAISITLKESISTNSNGKASGAASSHKQELTLQPPYTVHNLVINPSCPVHGNGTSKPTLHHNGNCNHMQ